MIVLNQEKEQLIMELAVRFEDGRYKRNIFTNKVEDLERFRKKYNNKSLHTSAFRYTSKDIENAKLYGDFYLDFDSHESFEYVREDVIRALSYLNVTFKIEYDKMVLYFSGNKGIHLIIPAEIFGLEPHENLHLIYKLIAEEIKGLSQNKTIDTQVYHKRAMIRLKNSIHEKTGKYKTEISLSELMNKKDIPSLCNKIRKINTNKYLLINETAKRALEEKKDLMEIKYKRKNKVSYDSTLDFDPPCIQYLLNNTTSQGGRNFTGTVLASHFRSRGYDNIKAKEELTRWNENYCYPKLYKREITTIINSIYNSNKRYGCSTLCKISECSDKCKLYRGGLDGK
jgi:hypothetical protein